MNHTHIPQPDPAAQTASDQLVGHIVGEIRNNGGSIPFSRFMELALYAPELGYYTGGSHKIGAAGDFITAPTLTPLFAQTPARQLLPLLSQFPQTSDSQYELYEFGAGTGALAADLLNALPDEFELRYNIIELSPELSQRQRQHIGNVAPEKYHLVRSLYKLPGKFNGIVIGNEVLDAMPVERVRWQNSAWQQICLTETQGKLQLAHRPAPPDLAAAADKYLPRIEGYTSELHLQQQAFIRTLAERLEYGALIFIDYGFDAAQYYHPQRHDGTLIGHYRHHTLHDPLQYLGLTDLTAHVNFSDIAAAGCGAGLDLIGYTTQANFLFNLGILELLAATSPDTATPEYIQAAHAVQQLTAQHEMGELFKVIAFGRGIDVDWQGFAWGDICHKL